MLGRMNRMNGKSRNGYATARGIGENRLRALEDRNILPEWSKVTAETYNEVVEAWDALRRAGWTNQRVGKVFELIRSNNFEAGRARAWRARLEYSIETLRRIWPKLPQASRDEWIKGGFTPFDLDPDMAPPPWEDEGK